VLQFELKSGWMERSIPLSDVIASLRWWDYDFI